MTKIISIFFIICISLINPAFANMDETEIIDQLYECWSGTELKGLQDLQNLQCIDKVDQCIMYRSGRMKFNEDTQRCELPETALVDFTCHLKSGQEKEACLEAFKTQCTDDFVYDEKNQRCSKIVGKSCPQGATRINKLNICVQEQNSRQKRSQSLKNLRKVSERMREVNRTLARVSSITSDYENRVKGLALGSCAKGRYDTALKSCVYDDYQPKTCNKSYPFKTAYLNKRVRDGYDVCEKERSKDAAPHTLNKDEFRISAKKTWKRTGFLTHKFNGYAIVVSLHDQIIHNRFLWSKEEKSFTESFVYKDKEYYISVCGSWFCSRAYDLYSFEDLHNGCAKGYQLLNSPHDKTRPCYKKRVDAPLKNPKFYCERNDTLKIKNNYAVCFGARADGSNYPPIPDDYYIGGREIVNEDVTSAHYYKKYDVQLDQITSLKENKIKETRLFIHDHSNEGKSSSTARNRADSFFFSHSAGMSFRACRKGSKQNSYGRIDAYLGSEEKKELISNITHMKKVLQEAIEQGIDLRYNKRYLLDAIYTEAHLKFLELQQKEHKKDTSVMEKIKILKKLNNTMKTYLNFIEDHIDELHQYRFMYEDAAYTIDYDYDKVCKPNQKEDYVNQAMFDLVYEAIKYAYTLQKEMMKDDASSPHRDEIIEFVRDHIKVLSRQAKTIIALYEKQIYFPDEEELILKRHLKSTQRSLDNLSKN